MLNFIKDITWLEIFEGWRIREGDDPGWINCATTIKGWSDWESWRKFSASQFNAENRLWKIFEFTDPIQEIPEILVGPYAGWQNRLKDKNKSSFEDMLNIPENYIHFKKNEKITSMIKNFPINTELIGLKRSDNGKIICIEGHHRATAVAIAKKEGISLGIKNIKIALADLEINELNLLDKILERGSSRK